MHPQPVRSAAKSLRHFNRFYTAQIGVLDRYLLGSGRSLSEARVLFELAQSDELTASDFVWKLGIDGGYLSRMLNGFEKEGLLQRRPSAKDRRVSHLVLTKKGHAVFATLDGLSQASAEALLEPLGEAKQQRLVTAMREIETMFEDKGTEPITLRPHRSGDMGWIVHRQALLYEREYGWDNSFEALLSEITAQFIRDFDPTREKCWVAERGGEIVGSIFLVRETDEAAKLRLLYVEASARGTGLGSRLVNECIAFARAKGYARIDLWTNDILTAARRIYERAGFKLVKEEPHHSFGHDLVGQYWSLDLASDRRMG
jgi:DNA-binding MarR family transcriptional regulator/GNAT superfamily N-acetyltransferase